MTFESFKADTGNIVPNFDSAIVRGTRHYSLDQLKNVLQEYARRGK
jgi:hypothetical protein